MSSSYRQKDKDPKKKKKESIIVHSNTILSITIKHFQISKVELAEIFNVNEMIPILLHL